MYSVIPEGFEPSTACLEGRCSIQLSYGIRKQRCTERKTPCHSAGRSNVGAARFELTTSCSQSRRDTGLRYAPKDSFHVFQLPFFYQKGCKGTLNPRNKTLQRQ